MKQLFEQNPHYRAPGRDRRRMHYRWSCALGVLCLAASLGTPAWAAENPVAFTTIQEYAAAVSQRDAIAAGQRDFVCLLQMKRESRLNDGKFPDNSDPIYNWCTQRRDKAHQRAIQSKDRALDAVWPGKDKLVDFADFQRFYIAETGSRQLAPSFFVMPQITQLQPDVPYTMEQVSVGAVPHASFQLAESDPVVAAPTTLVTVRIAYPNPMTAPVSNAAGSEDWAVPYKKPQGIVKAVKVKWVVLSDLKQFGFPVDHAVLDIPLEGPHGTTIPFVIEAGGFASHSTEWWGPEDAPEALHAGLEQARAEADSHEALMLLNRILLVHPKHEEALDTFAQLLYDGLLRYGQRLHQVKLPDGPLAQRFNELYWTIQSQTDRMDLSLHMEMGGKAEPMPADYLYRVIPVMEMLSSLRPGDFENLRRLGNTYRWTNDQLAAISTPQELLTQIPADQKERRSHMLLELAWSRIGKVAWNRHFDDPDLTRGFDEAKNAMDLTGDPLNRFAAAYAMAYSLAFRVPLDKPRMVELLQQAHDSFTQISGATPEAWAYLFQNDTLRGFVDTDPSFQALVAAN